MANWIKTYKGDACNLDRAATIVLVRQNPQSDLWAVYANFDSVAYHVIDEGSEDEMEAVRDRLIASILNYKLEHNQ